MGAYLTSPWSFWTSAIDLATGISLAAEWTARNGEGRGGRTELLLLTVDLLLSLEAHLAGLLHLGLLETGSGLLVAEGGEGQGELAGGALLVEGRDVAGRLEGLGGGGRIRPQAAALLLADLVLRDGSVEGHAAGGGGGSGRGA